MNTYALGHLPIELTQVGTGLTITPIYFPYDDDEFRKIYYKADELFVCLEIEDGRHRFVRRRLRFKKYKTTSGSGVYTNIKKKLHTKFFVPRNFRWTVTTSDLGISRSLLLSDIYNFVYSQFRKGTGWKFKVRGTYRYNWCPNMTNTPRPTIPNLIKHYHYARTHIFSNELELTMPNGYIIS